MVQPQQKGIEDVDIFSVESNLVLLCFQEWSFECNAEERLCLLQKEGGNREIHEVRTDEYSDDRAPQ